MKINVRNITLAAISAVVLSGCIVANPRPLTFAELGTVEQFQLNQNTFKMTFTSSAQATNLSSIDPQEVALLHAAKLTQAYHFNYFKITDAQVNPAAQVRSVVISPPVFQLGVELGRGHYPYRGYGRTRGYWGYPLYGYGGWYGFDSPYGFDGVYNHEYTQTIGNNKVIYTLVCANQTTMTNGTADMYDAALIEKTLGPKFGLGATPLVGGTPPVAIQQTNK